MEETEYKEKGNQNVMNSFISDFVKYLMARGACQSCTIQWVVSHAIY